MLAQNFVGDFGGVGRLAQGKIGSGIQGTMANWPSSQAFEDTGVLTAFQPKQLVQVYKTQGGPRAAAAPNPFAMLPLPC